MNKYINQIIILAIVVFMGMAQLCSIAIAADTNPTENKATEQKQTIYDLRYKFVKSNGDILKNKSILMLFDASNSPDLAVDELVLDKEGITNKQVDITEDLEFPPKPPLNITFLKKDSGFANLKINSQEELNALPDTVTIKWQSGAYVSGKVIDSKNKKPLCGMVILPTVVKSKIDVGIWNRQFDAWLNRYNPFAEMATFTDENGNFKVGPLPEGVCELQVGFDLEKSIKLSIKNKDIKNYIIRLKPSKPGVTIKGRAFLLDTKHPIIKTKIDIVVWDNYHSEAHDLWELISMVVTTDSKGYFTLYPVRKENYRFESEYKGYSASTSMSVKSKNPMLNLIYKKD